MGQPEPQDLEAALESFGAEVAALQDVELANRRSLADVRARLLSTPKPIRRRSRGPYLAMAAACLLAAAGTYAAWPPTSGAPEEVPETVAALTYAISSDTAHPEASIPGSPGRWVASESTPQTLSFSDGSETQVAPRSNVRIAALRPEGAHLDLQRGALRVHVEHREDTAWEVQAGPFSVAVVGTTFDVAWDPDEERFDLHLEEGEVRVTGPGIEQRSVRTGQTLTVELPETDRPTPADTPALDTVVQVSEAPTSTESQARPRRPRRDSPAPAAPDWRALARQARHGEAVAAADWDQELNRASSGDLLLLGDAARLSGSPAQARRAYLGLRDRFPQSTEAVRSAFLLGRLAMRGGNAASAAAWFERAVNEDPNGRYAMMAAGRRIEAYRQAGNEIAAARAAQSYLRRYPQGPHAATARELLADVGENDTMREWTPD